MLKDFYSLTKSGLVYGNLVIVIGGFMLASQGGVNFVSLFATVIGMAFVMASGCVFNNYIDRDVDAAMARTKDRALVMGRVSGRAALWFGIVLGAAGFIVLGVWTNILALAAAAFGFFAYVVLYSLWAKRRTVYGTVVGSLAGAVPPVVGYCAASDRLDLGAALLFIILVLWQMPHFYAIAIYRSEDYAAADIPVLPLKKGIATAKWNMAVYIFAFCIATAMLAMTGYIGRARLLIPLLFGVVWLGFSVWGFWVKPDQDKKWARKMFFISLIVLMGLFISLAVLRI